VFGVNGKRGEDDGEEGEWEEFDGPEVTRLGSAAQRKTDEQEDMRERSESEDDPEVQQEVMIERGTVRAGVCRKERRKKGREVECEGHSLKDNA
jgi:hypothetical protein